MSEAFCQPANESVAKDILVTITFIMLCHDSPMRIISRVSLLLNEDPTCKVIVHFDKKSSRKKFKEVCRALGSHPRCHIIQKRVRCGWGKWGLVNASLKAIKYSVEDERFNSDYFYLLSEYCHSTKPLFELRRYLSCSLDADFIEVNDSSWVKAGIREGRYLRYHFFDKRKHPKLHRWSYKLQVKLGVKKAPPPDFDIKFGSQWWCLSSRVASEVVEYTETKCIWRFFKTVWIPDEIFFQSIVPLISHKLVSASLTYNEFDADGKPLSIKSPSKFSNLPDIFFIRKCE